MYCDSDQVPKILQQATGGKYYEFAQSQEYAANIFSNQANFFIFINNNNYLAAICAYRSLYINGSETAAYNRGFIRSIRDEYCTKQSTV
ncbi:hypothetical protein WI233_11735 [Salmonella enterica subsp. enterica serovar Infantis]